MICSDSTATRICRPSYFLQATFTPMLRVGNYPKKDRENGIAHA